MAVFIKGLVRMMSIKAQLPKSDVIIRRMYAIFKKPNCSVHRNISIRSEEELLPNCDEIIKKKLVHTIESFVPFV